MEPAGTTLELAAYALVVAAAAAKLAWQGYSYSLMFERGGAWAGYAPGLRRGWLGGRSVDLSDIQWREFRGALPALGAAMAVFVAASRLLQRRQRQPAAAQGRPGNGCSSVGDVSSADGSSSNISSRSRLGLYLITSVVFLAYLHGPSAAFPVGLAAASFVVARRLAGRRYGAAAIWGFNVAALLAARVWNGFPFGSISPMLAPLDVLRGPVRWEICFNLSLLRMLSFALDLHWRRRRAHGRGPGVPGGGPSAPAQEGRGPEGLGGSERATAATGARALLSRPASPAQPSKAEPGQHQQEREQQTQQQQAREQQAQRQQSKLTASREDQQAEQPQPRCTAAVSGPAGRRRLSPGEAAARWRQATPLPSERDYSLAMFLAYVFYLPLYLAGPIMTFHDFAWQQRRPARPSRREVLRYAARFAADWVCLELLTHTLYFPSLAKHRIGMRYRAHGLQYGPLEIAMTGFWVLCFMWLKFATIWRFFRLAAMLEGVVPPDNMRRCFANNYDAEGFWKGWHSSYNAWLVRYLYVPLGGARWRALNIWPIFLFVALWHDLEWRLVAWAWLVCLAFVPELAIKKAAASPRLAAWRRRPSFRHAAAALAALNIAALMCANLAGFVVGPGGLAALLRQLLRQPALVGASLGVFYCVAQLMFALRAHERGAPCLRPALSPK